MSNISIIMKHRRKELGISAEIVAERAGLSAATIYRYESGDIKNMGLDKVELLAKALHCSPVYLMGWEDEPHITSVDTSTRPDMATERYKNITDILDTMNDEGVEKVEQYAEDIAPRYKKHGEPEMVHHA